jgi:hypothetical protein
MRRKQERTRQKTETAEKKYTLYLHCVVSIL